MQAHMVQKRKLKNEFGGVGMNTKIKDVLLTLLVLCISVLVSENAQAVMSMPERERAQSIVWIVEIATFITALAIAFIVWKVSKRDKKNNKTSEVDQG